MQTWHRKAFAYVVRQNLPAPQLLAAASLMGAGYEVVRGTIEPGETPEQGIVREVLEESGIAITGDIHPIGVTYWENEEQHFFLMQAPDGLPDSFSHVATGGGGDTGMVFAYRWLDINADLSGQLVEGGNAFVLWLLEYFPAGTERR
jgi:8-oxo-dGTP pyrophosphatase MutT (NUDIX family)